MSDALSPIIELLVRVDGKLERKFVGRFAWTLNELIRADDKGCTSIGRPAPRSAHHAFPLRGDGVSIKTITKPHSGAYCGHHARYRLASHAQVLKTVRAGEDRDAA
jgi:hypothetical protein